MYPPRPLPFLTLIALACLGLSPRAGASNPALNVVYSFTNGLSPNAGVIQGTNGHFHGVTATGGPGNFGGLYEVTGNGILVTNIWLNGTNGAMPLSPLIQDKSGNFYGTASGGGVKNNGTIFEITSAGQLKLLASFNQANGATPLAPLLEGTNGWFYGATFNGGSNNLGSIFRVSAAGVLTNVHSFGGSDGANPAAGLIQGTDGNLYGTTDYGGDNGLGTVFQLTYAGTLSTLCSFTNETGAFPGGLVEDRTGNFYGATLSGGLDFAGTIFKLSPSGTVQVLFSFGVSDISTPNSPLIMGQDGSLYGTTREGGGYGRGAIFALNVLSRRSTLTNLISFDDADGAAPRSGLIQGRDGNFYGTTSQGGAFGYGEIYQLTGFAPFIIQPPASQRWASNATARFSVTAGGSAPLSFQWQFQGTNLPGAMAANLAVSHEQLANSGTYTVFVSNAFGAVSASAVLSVAAPNVTILSPPATVSNSSLVVSGKAAGPNGVASVLYQLNSNGWFAASGTTNWLANVTLLPGTNNFQAESLDPVGNASAIKNIAIFYAITTPLTLQTNGFGSISASFKGTNLIVDRSYTVRAIPGTGQLFLSWVGSVSATHNPLTFAMQSNMVLQANFVTNPFIAAAGTYAGLFFASNAVSEPSAGLLSSLVLKTSGAYSGQLVIKGVHYGFTGGFGPSEQSSATVARANAQGGSLAMGLTLRADEVTGAISGTDAGGWTSALLAERVGSFVGSAQYTMLIPSGPGAPSNGPPGDGYALVANHNGVVTLSGAVADGAAFSQTVPVVGAGDLPFYASLYGNTGLLLGWLKLDGGLSGTNLWWIKTPSSFSVLYPNGFTNLVTNVLASVWTNPPPNFLPSATLAISNAGFALDFAVSLTNNTLKKESGPTSSLTGIFYPKTGLLRITFGSGAGKATTTGYAAILQDSSSGGGYFLTKTNAGTITLGP